MDVPRIIILDLSHRYGGASERGIGILKSLPKGCGALVALKNSPVTDRAKRLGLEVHCVGSHKLDPRIGNKLSGVIGAGGFQLIDSQNPQSRFWGSLVSGRTGIIHVATLNSWPFKEYGGRLKGCFYRLVDGWVSGRADFFVAVSAEIQAELVAAGNSEEKIALIPNAVDVEAPAGSGDGDWLRESYGIPADAFVCCAVGRLTEVKGHRYLIDSISRLSEHGGNLYCLILGDGDQRGALTNQIAKRGLSGRVRLLGDQDHQVVLRIVHASNFFVMPSLSEGTPLALLEAAALGLPIVASDVGGIPEVVTHHRSGLLIPPADILALSKALIWMCENVDTAAQFGRHAREVVAQRFAIQRLVDDLISAYRQAIMVRAG